MLNTVILTLSLGITRRRFLQYTFNLHSERGFANKIEACVYFQNGKQRKPVERRESSRLQSAAKLLRSLSKTKDVAKSSVESPSKVNKEHDDRPELPDRNHPAYLSEGKGSRKRKNSGKENKEGKLGKDRSHSFHGKVDKKERKYVALERKASEQDNKKYKDDLPDNPSQCHRGEEPVVQGARSILLTEDNLIPIKERLSSAARAATSPDLIQDLPRTGVPGLLSAASGARTSEDRDNANDDDDYVEADSVALDASEQEDNDICPSGHGASVHQDDVRTMSPTDLDRVMETGSADNGVRSKDTR